ncbi:MAG: hypothetical protein IJA85_01235 [Clostridia bacterium]|nr:hypothetical protein [Clostridia bacterium]
MKKKQLISGLLLAAIMLGTFSCGGETPAADTETAPVTTAAETVLETAPDTSAEALFTPTLKEELGLDGKWTLDVYGEMCAAVADDLSFSPDPADIYQRSGGDVPLQPLTSGGLDF